MNCSLYVLWGISGTLFYENAMWNFDLDFLFENRFNSDIGFDIWFEITVDVDFDRDFRFEMKVNFDE